MEVQEGDILDVIVMLDDTETGKMKESIKELMDDVWEKPEI
jgi:ribosomal protein S1